VFSFRGRILRFLISSELRNQVKSILVAPMSTKHSQPACEDSLIKLLQDRHTTRNALVRKGIGDDAAVIRPRNADEFWLITTDMLVEGIDFHLDWTTPGLLGRKSISVNLSDLAAMGARPRFFTVSLAIPPGISERWILEFHAGLAEKGNALGAHLIGGDLSRTKAGVAISITAIGESLNRKVLYRSGGRAGDFLYVTGTLGRSAAGLRLLEAGTRKGRRGGKEALRAHQDPEPRCDAGLWLAQCGLVHCMMDLSDGLSMDLPRLCTENGVGAEIHVSALPIFRESAFWACDPLELALHGGEDYELLFAVPRSVSRHLEKTYPSRLPRITCIGEMTSDAANVWLIGSEKDGVRRRLPRLGWDHFSRA
jgi:thiamine-monophosphate kinase